MRRNFRSTPSSILVIWTVLAGVLILPGFCHAHPSLYFTRERLPALQARTSDATTNALGYEFAGVFEQIRALADQYKSTPCTYTVDIPDPDGTGSQTWSYTVSTSMPPAHPNNPRYPPWTGLTRTIQIRMETMAFVFAMTGDESYLTNPDGFGALDLALAVSSWTQWTDPGYGCGGLTCLDTAHLTMGAAMVYDLGFDFMSDADRDALREAIVQLGIVPLSEDVTDANESGNAQLWFNGYALRVTGLAVGAAAVSEDMGMGADQWLSLANESLVYFFGSQGSDGGTYEGQLYGSYAVDQLVTAAHVLSLNGIGHGLFSNEWLNKLPAFVSSFLGSSNKQLANFGDSTTAAYWASTMFALAYHGNHLAQWYLSITKLQRPDSPRTFVWARPDLEPIGQAGSGTSVFRDVGHAVLRDGFSGAAVVAVKSGPPLTDVGHNHLDSNSFIISAYGEWIAADPGYRSYFNAPERVYTTESVGHNTLMVDKWVSAAGDAVAGGQVHRTGGSLDYLLDGAGYAKIVANAAETYDAGLLDRFARRVFFAKPDLVFVFDDVAASSSHEFSFLLHANAGATVYENDLGPSEMLLAGHSARIEAFFVSTEPLKSGFPKAQQHQGAEKYGPYAEWRTTSCTDVRFVTALVPGQLVHADLANPGFEDDLSYWQPRFSDGSHSVDETLPHGGTKCAHIDFPESRSGYFYSEPLSVLPSASMTVRFFVRAQATGTVNLRIYLMHEGAYIDEPAGDFVTLDADSADDWTQLELISSVPDSGVDAVRLALQFTGTGSVWFDDVFFRTNPSFDPTPLSRAVALGDPPVGLVVEGPFGVEAAASFVGASESAPHVLVPETDEIPFVADLSSDGSLFALGLGGDGEFKRAFLQGGTFISVGQTVFLQTASPASLDVGVKRDASGCSVLWATEVPTMEAPPYSVRIRVGQVILNGSRVPFAVEDDKVVFPMGSDMGTGCPPDNVDGGQGDGDGDGDGGIQFDGYGFDAGADPGQDHDNGSDTGDDAGTVADDSPVNDAVVDAGTSTGENMPDAGLVALSGGCSCGVSTRSRGLVFVLWMLVVPGLWRYHRKSIARSVF